MATLKYKDPVTKEVKSVISTVVSEDPSSSLPTVTYADDGKILRVVGGMWMAVYLPSAEFDEF